MVDPSRGLDPIPLTPDLTYASAASVYSMIKVERSDVRPNRGIWSAVLMGPQPLEQRAIRLIEIRGDDVYMDRAIGRARSNATNRSIRSLECPVSGRWLAGVQVAEVRAALERWLVYGQRVPRPPFVLRPGSRREEVAVLNGDGHRPALSDVDVLSTGNFGNLRWSARSKMVTAYRLDTRTRRRPCRCHSGTQ
jgi:hypothetical protein